MTIRAATRTQRRLVEVREYRCVYCGHWHRPRRAALTCSASCRTMLARLRARGVRPDYAA